jgi:hypothetical protein
MLPQWKVTQKCTKLLVKFKQLFLVSLIKTVLQNQNIARRTAMLTRATTSSFHQARYLMRSTGHQLLWAFHQI